MNGSMTLTIQDFNTVLRSEQDESVIMQTLRQLMSKENEKAVVSAVRHPPHAATTWAGWAL